MGVNPRSERLAREAGRGSWGMTPLRGERLKKHQKADAAKWTVSARSDLVFGIRYWRRRVGWTRCGIGRQPLSGAFELELAGWAEDAVIANFGGAAWQDVFEEAMDELDSGKCDMPNLMRSIVGVAKADLPILDGFQAAVGDSDAENVSGQILKDLVATASLLGMHDPFFLPYGRWRELEQAGLVQSRAEFRLEDNG